MWQAAWNYFFRETLSNQKLETNKYVAEGKTPNGARNSSIAE